MSGLVKQPSETGFQYLEVIIVAAILLMLAHAFFTLITSAYQLLGLSRIQASARSLANQEVETIRNLPYDDVGTDGGIPSGTLAQVKQTTINGQTYTITTTVVYMDDPFDGLAPADLLPTDYKRVKIRVDWAGTFPSSDSVELITDISPQGMETDVGGGTLSVLVFDADGQPVPQAEVTVQAPSAVPPIDLVLLTDNDGILLIPGAPACISCYNISVTKTGFSTDRTYDAGEVTNPSKPPVTILEDEVSQISFGVDELTSVSFTSVGAGPTYATVGNVDFHLTGTKTIGTDVSGDPVYKVDDDYTTDGSGSLSLDLEWDSYTMRLDNVNYALAGSSPLTPIVATAGETADVTFVRGGFAGHSLLAQIKDASGSAIASASARLTRSLSGYDETISSGQTGDPDEGASYFIDLPEGGSYNLEVTHPDFLDSTTSVDVNGATETTVVMNGL